MTSSPTRTTDIPSSPLASRSFLSRLRSPLSSKTRNFTEFYIQSDDPHRQYTPGDIITGTVIIKVVKPVRLTHLVVSLHGYAQVFKNPNAPGDAYKNYCATVGLGKGKKAGGYFGNGFVSLFEDEVVLCGEGRLSEGVYHFNFELEFPAKGLPSSIDFERGTVSYMLTATLTRPTTILPTTTCDTKVYLTDIIDVAPIPEPKPRVISLEPISKRSRGKSSRKRERGPQTPIGSETQHTTSAVQPNGTLDESEGPRSPSPSDVSYESQMSSGNASRTEYGVRSVNTGAFSLQNGSRTTLEGRTITTSIHVLKGGFLRGDQIPIKIAVNHTKHVRSLKGIIVTLYRQARVDMYPLLPIPNSKGDKCKSEDYFPKSRTGLGGLSLSSAGSSHLFRKDLCQSFAPLFVDPRTLTAEVKCAVRVPDEAFPTISNVPGAMISFKYYVEVVVDIQGKLTGLDRMVANTGLVNIPSTTADASGTGRDDGTSNMFSTWGGSFIETDQIRREKGIISSIFEVVIGTKDSERNGKRKQTREPSPNGQNGIHEIPFSGNNEPNTTDGYDQDYYGYDENGQYHDYSYDSAYYDIPGYDQYDAEAGASYHAPPENEEAILEKERMRRAEAYLLPSQPPDAAGPSGSPRAVQYAIPASAPIILEDDDPNPSYLTAESSSSATLANAPPPFRAAVIPSISLTPTAQSLQQHARGLFSDETRTTTAGSSLTFNGNHQELPAAHGSGGDQSHPLPCLPPPSLSGNSGAAPEYYPPSSSHLLPTDDKQELQRRRLETERSAPPGEHEEEARMSQRASAPPINGMWSLGLAPSAPTLDEDDEGLADIVRPGRSTQGVIEGSVRGGDALPEYQR